MGYRDVAKSLSKVDRLLSYSEISTIDRITEILNDNFTTLSSELRSHWRDGNRAIGSSDRAVLILNELTQYLSLISRDDSVKAALESLLSEARTLGVNLGSDLIGDITNDGQSPRITPRTVDLNIAAIAYQVEHTQLRLKRYDTDFRLLASDAITTGLVRGSGVGRVIDRLTQATGVMGHQIESIVRTETMAALDHGTRDTYKDNGIEYVQRIATQDARVCPYCAGRAGNVYELSKAPAALHPQDRCYNIPWRREWQDNGLVDVAWLQSHRQAAIDKLKDRGLKPNSGQAPFERLTGVSAPTPVWTLPPA